MLKETLPPRRILSTPWALRWMKPLWALFGNEDDGIYGDDRWRGTRNPTPWLAIVWWFRNPFHNLFFYMIGIADHPRTFYSTKEWGTPGWTFHLLRSDKYRWIWLPFASYKKAGGGFNFYAGWRPYGAFGFKLNFAK